MDEYARKHLIYHLEQAERWEDIADLTIVPMFKKEARLALWRHLVKSGKLTISNGEMMIKEISQ